MVYCYGGRAAVAAADDAPRNPHVFVLDAPQQGPAAWRVVPQ
eukprot:gene51153-22485_t